MDRILTNNKLQTKGQEAMTIPQKLFIGVLLPMLESVPAAFIGWMSWPRFGPAGQLLTSLFLVGILIPAVALLNLWVLPIRWEKPYHCFLAGMCVPIVAVVLELVYYKIL